MKKYIIIIGEEYWFEVKADYEWEGKRYTSNYKEANFLLETLKKNNSEYEYIILNGPAEFVDNVTKLGKENIRAIFFFHDVFSDSILNKMTIMEMKNYLLDLENNHNVYLYPGINKTMLFGSKEYYKTLINKFPYMALPNSKVYIFKNYKGYENEKEIVQKLYSTSKYLLKYFEKIVIKKGFSYEAKQIRVIDRDDIFDFHEFRKKLYKLNLKRYWNIKASAIDMDVGIDRHYILQGYNEIVTNRLNEYRVFFYNGKARYISWQTDLDNLCTDDIENIDNNIIVTNDKRYIFKVYDKENNQIDDESVKKEYNKHLLSAVLKYAKKVYKDFLPTFWDKEEPPILFRLDISYAVDSAFIDKYAINVHGMDNKIRLYINEIEIDPTNYFYNNIICNKNTEITSEYLQKLFGNLINNFINKNL